MKTHAPVMPSLLDKADLPAARSAGPAADPKASQRKRRWQIGASVAMLAVSAVLLGRLLAGPVDPGAASRVRVVIDAETGEIFERFQLPEGGRAPYTHPKTGRATLYPAEQCYWTRDGKAKFTPTYVLLNEYAGRPGGTVCPDCGKEVVSHNPMPPESVLAEAVAEAERGG